MGGFTLAAEEHQSPYLQLQARIKSTSLHGQFQLLSIGTCRKLACLNLGGSEVPMQLNCVLTCNVDDDLGLLIRFVRVSCHKESIGIGASVI